MVRGIERALFVFSVILSIGAFVIAAGLGLGPIPPDELLLWIALGVTFVLLLLILAVILLIDLVTH